MAKEMLLKESLKLILSGCNHEEALKHFELAYKYSPQSKLFQKLVDGNIRKLIANE